MTKLTPNIPAVVEEIRQCFKAYEQALIDKNVGILDGTFWRSPHTVRLAMNEHDYGFEEIHSHRIARQPGPGIKKERLRFDISRLGCDFRTVNLVFKVLG